MKGAPAFHARMLEFCSRGEANGGTFLVVGAVGKDLDAEFWKTSAGLQCQVRNLCCLSTTLLVRTDKSSITPYRSSGILSQCQCRDGQLIESDPSFPRR